MKKSSKQNKNNRKNSKKQQAKNQHAKNQRRQQRKLKAKRDEQTPDASGNIDAVTVKQRRKALLAQFRQTQWKQKVKAGNAAAAKVEKVYNRGG